MDTASLEQLDRLARLYVAAPTRKVLRAPLRLARARLLRAASRLRGRPIEVTATTFWGDPMRVTIPDGVSLVLYTYGFFELGLTRILLDRLQPGATFFDVGGHYGYFTLLASRLVGDAGHVHTFEPTPATFRVLARNTAGRPNVTLNPLAVHAADATLTFTDFADEPSLNTLGAGNIDDRARGGLRGVTREVRATSIDRYTQTTGARPDFIKLDAEGAEQEIFKGMEHTFAEVRPVITLEVGDFGAAEIGKSRALIQSVVDRGYEAYEYDPATARIVPHRLKDTLYLYDNILLTPRK